MEWAVAQNELRNYINSTLVLGVLNDNFTCIDYIFSPGSYVQAAIGDVSDYSTILFCFF